LSSLKAFRMVADRSKGVRPLLLELIGLTTALSAEFAKKNIYVNAIAPGPVRTEMFESLPTSLQERFAETTHVGRVCEPNEIAHGVVFLLENDFMAGEILNMSAGRYMD
jgi:NAD(P)-dependent dehydrogenase (short-subunit alcohol dehydrogenase family)